MSSTWYAYIKTLCTSTLTVVDAVRLLQDPVRDFDFEAAEHVLELPPSIELVRVTSSRCATRRPHANNSVWQRGSALHAVGTMTMT